MFKKFIILFFILNLKTMEENLNFDDLDFEGSIYNNLSDEELNFYDNSNLADNNNDFNLDESKDLFNNNLSDINIDDNFEEIDEYSNFVSNFLKEKLLIWENFIEDKIENNKKKIKLCRCKKNNKI